MVASDPSALLIEAPWQQDNLVTLQAPRRVLVRYESSAAGRAALRYALDIARSNSELRVMTVATHERVDVGCASCRQSAAIWNREMRSIAEEELAEAAALIGQNESVVYQVIRGQPQDAIRKAAAGSHASMIVLPSAPGRLGRRRVSRLADDLRRDGPWQVIVAPAELAAGLPRRS